jgi:pSer/pThr/pTyr-binding forkhead associated (FHA) protein
VTVDETIVVRWGGQERRFAPGDTVVLGRDPASAVVLSAPSVSRRHAELRFADGRWSLVDLGSTQGVYRDGQRVGEVVVDGTVAVVLGNADTGERVELVATDDRTETVDGAGFAAPTELPQRPGGQLREEELSGATVVTGHGINVSCAGTSLTVQPGQQVVIGRDAGADITSTNPTVSRQHLQISHDGSTWVAEDLGSSGGTFLDGRRVTKTDLAGSMALWLGDPDTGERVVTVTSGERTLTAAQRIERASRGRSGLVLAGVAVVALLALLAGLLALRSGGSSSPDNAQLARASVKLIVDGGSGSGTVIDAKQGLILTNSHVVKPQAPGQALVFGLSASDLEPDPQNIIVAVAPDLDKAAEPKFRAQVVAYDGYLDLAVVKITNTVAGAVIASDDLKDLHQIEIGDSDAVRSGDDLRVVGFPGVAESEAATLTKGVVSGAEPDNRLQTNRSLLNIDAKIEPGNSGGLAVDSKGRLIGVPSQSRTDRASGARIDAMRPVNLAKDLIAKAKAGDDYASPYVRPLTGKEALSGFDVITPTISSGFALGCANAAVTSASEGDTSVSLAFDYSGFEADAHQDMLVAVTAGRDVLGTVETKDQFPFRWQASGSACVTVPLKAGLAKGTYAVALLVGPNYERSASGVTFTVE